MTMNPPDTPPPKAVMLKACPFCGSDEHLSFQSVGALTNDMPARPKRVICTHIDHDTVTGPVAYGKPAAIAAWNTRTSTATPAAVGREASEAMVEALQAIIARAPERDRKWAGMTARDIAIAALSGPAGAGEEMVGQARQVFHDAMTAAFKDGTGNPDHAGVDAVVRFVITRLSTTDRFAEGLEAAANAVFAAEFPKERWSCSDDESGTALTLQRQKQFLAAAIRNLTKEGEG